jgi:hypothetical protein
MALALASYKGGPTLVAADGASQRSVSSVAFTAPRLNPAVGRAQYHDCAHKHNFSHLCEYPL